MNSTSEHLSEKNILQEVEQDEVGEENNRGELLSFSNRNNKTTADSIISESNSQDSSSNSSKCISEDRSSSAINGSINENLDDIDKDRASDNSMDSNSFLINQQQNQQTHHQQLPRICNNINLFSQQQQQQQQHHQQDDEITQSHNQYQNNQQRQLLNENDTTEQQSEKDFEEVKQVELFGISIVALTINGKERLCLAQISNTLLKEFSYNEIHNRRVALGITCVQCTPIQLEMLRRAGAMPSSSRRCGMITRREAERLCRSFLVEEQPPELPENFHFTVAHRVNYGCKGKFIPARYISSRAKCIECFYCGEFYSPNKFIFHSHRQPHATDCNPPDSPNINSWRKHIDLDWTQEHSQDIKYAWEDVKSLFNGGTRRRAPNWSNLNTNNFVGSETNNSIISTETVGNTNNSSFSTNNSSMLNVVGKINPHKIDQKFKIPLFNDETDQLIDVECYDQQQNYIKTNLSSKFESVLESDDNNNKNDIKLNRSNKLFNKLLDSSNSPTTATSSTSDNNNNNNKYQLNRKNSFLNLPQSIDDYNKNISNRNYKASLETTTATKNLSRHNHNRHLKRSISISTQNEHQQQQIGNSKRQITRQQDDHHHSTTNRQSPNNNLLNSLPQMSKNNFQRFSTNFTSPIHHKTDGLPSSNSFCDFLPTTTTTTASFVSNTNTNTNTNTNSINQSNMTGNFFNINQSCETDKTLSQVSMLNQMASSYPQTNFIYNQLYTQLMQQSQQQQPSSSSSSTNKQDSPSQFQLSSQLNIGGSNATAANIDAQLALRHHLWSSLIANLQCNANNQIYNGLPQQQQQQQQQTELNSNNSQCNNLLGKDLVANNINNFDTNHLKTNQQISSKNERNQINQNISNLNPMNSIYLPKSNVSVPFSMRTKPYTTTEHRGGDSTN